VTGRPHTIEIWFGMRADGSVLYLLAGGEGDWLRNLRKEPGVTVRIGSGDAPEVAAAARVVEARDEDAGARRLLLEKYRPRYAGDLTSWGRTATPVALEPV
jgi:nitroimidazol reductase NimA-like FMN-containing flavoprotein (pyridoxamine 5'-phosphate oxidase superfamily)